MAERQFADTDIQRIYDASFDVFCKTLGVGLKKPELSSYKNYLKRFPNDDDYDSLAVTFWQATVYNDQRNIVIIPDIFGEDTRIAACIFFHEFGHALFHFINPRFSKTRRPILLGSGSSRDREKIVSTQIFNEGLATYLSINIPQKTEVDSFIPGLSFYIDTYEKDIIEFNLIKKLRTDGLQVYHLKKNPKLLLYPKYKFRLGYKFTCAIKFGMDLKKIKKAILHPPVSIEELLHPKKYLARVHF